MATQQERKVRNPAGVSLLLSALMVETRVMALCALSSDGQFSWMDGEASEIDAETLTDVLMGALTDSALLEWDSAPGGLKRTSFGFDAETLVIYLIDASLALGAIVDEDASLSALDSAVGNCVGKLRSFI